MLPQIKKILYATALSDGSPGVFRYALSLAQRYDARISIIHAVETLSPFSQSLIELHISHEKSEEIHQAAQEKYKADIVQRVEDLCASELCNDPTGRNRVSNIQVVEGQPARSILLESERTGADLIVMGTHRHSVLGEALLGTTAHKVLHSSTTPVLLVRIPNDN